MERTCEQADRLPDRVGVVDNEPSFGTGPAQLSIRHLGVDS